MSYLDDLGTRIRGHALAAGLPTRDLMTRRLDSLFRLYAVLALAKGEAVTDEDVHNAWAAWRQNADDDHSALLPFGELDDAHRAQDRPYAEAIRSVARELSAVPAEH